MSPIRFPPDPPPSPRRGREREGEGARAGRRLILGLGVAIALLSGILAVLLSGALESDWAGPPQAKTSFSQITKSASAPVVPVTSLGFGRASARAPGPKAVILIDDLGSSIKTARKLMSIDLPVSFAVLPHLRYSRQIALEAKLRGREVLLHLPLEPDDYPKENPGPGSLLLSQTPAEWHRRTRAALDAVPGISGVNNHMGSRFTERTDAMEVILGELKGRGLFFVDSYTSARSVAAKISRRLGVRVAQRTIFLDNEADEDKIAAQLDRLIAQAKKKGQAFGIGHPYKETIAALGRAAEKIRRSGVRIVPSAEVVR